MGGSCLPAEAKKKKKLRSFPWQATLVHDRWKQSLMSALDCTCVHWLQHGGVVSHITSDSWIYTKPQMPLATLRKQGIKSTWHMTSEFKIHAIISTDFQMNFSIFLLSWNNQIHVQCGDLLAACMLSHFRCSGHTCCLMLKCNSVNLIIALMLDGLTTTVALSHCSTTCFHLTGYLGD